MSKPGIRELTSKAKERLLRLQESPDDNVALLAAIEILDRAEGRKGPRLVLDSSAVELTISVKSRLH